MEGGQPSALKSSDALILAAVSALGEGCYGRTIWKRISESGFSMQQASVHRALQRMETAGLLAGRDGESTPVRGGRAKRHFRLTAVGVEVLEHHRSIVGQLLEALGVVR